MSLLDKLTIKEKIGDEIGDELGHQFALDPVPNEPPAARKGQARRKTAQPRATGTAKLAKEVSEDLATLLEGAAAVWGFQDQCCSPILEQQARPIAHALTAILSRNPRLLSKFANTDIVAYTLQSVALGKALAPVGQAIYRNHVSKAVEEDHDDHGAIHLDQFPTFSGISRTQSA